MKSIKCINKENKLFSNEQDMQFKAEVSKIYVKIAEEWKRFFNDICEKWINKSINGSLQSFKTGCFKENIQKINSDVQRISKIFLQSLKNVQSLYLQENYYTSHSKVKSLSHKEFKFQKSRSSSLRSTKKKIPSIFSLSKSPLTNNPLSKFIKKKKPSQYKPEFKSTNTRQLCEKNDSNQLLSILCDKFMKSCYKFTPLQQNLPLQSSIKKSQKLIESTRSYKEKQLQQNNKLEMIGKQNMMVSKDEQVKGKGQQVKKYVLNESELLKEKKQKGIEQFLKITTKLILPISSKLVEILKKGIIIDQFSSQDLGFLKDSLGKLNKLLNFPSQQDKKIKIQTYIKQLIKSIHFIIFKTEYIEQSNLTNSIQSTILQLNNHYH